MTARCPKALSRPPLHWQCSTSGTRGGMVSTGAEEQQGQCVVCSGCHSGCGRSIYIQCTLMVLSASISAGCATLVEVRT